MTIAALFGGDPTRTKNTLFDLMAQHGASKLEASYSGGNDEGGVGSLQLLDAAGEKLETPEMWITRTPKEGERAYHHDGLIHEYHPLYEAVDNVLSLEFGTWAGDFNAYGTLYADATTREVRREGSISHEEYDDDGGYF